MCTHTHSLSMSIYLQEEKRTCQAFGVWNHGSAAADSPGVSCSFQPYSLAILAALLLARLACFFPQLFLGLVLALRLMSLLLLLGSPLRFGLHRLPRRRFRLVSSSLD